MSDRNLSIEAKKRPDGKYEIYIGEENSSGWMDVIDDISEIGNSVNRYLAANPKEN